MIKDPVKIWQDQGLHNEIPKRTTPPTKKSPTWRPLAVGTYTDD